MPKRDANVRIGPLAQDAAASAISGRWLAIRLRRGANTRASCEAATLRACIVAVRRDVKARNIAVAPTLMVVSRKFNSILREIRDEPVPVATGTTANTVS